MKIKLKLYLLYVCWSVFAGDDVEQAGKRRGANFYYKLYCNYKISFG